MKRPIFYIIFISIGFMFCTNSSSIKTADANSSKYLKFDKANWLIGKWQNRSAEGILLEIWEKKNDSTLIGSSFFIVENDTVSSETINIEERGKDLYYIPTVKNQNNGKPIIFTLTSLSNNQFVFENPSHDFPQKIIYTQITNDSLVAIISGAFKGNEKSQSFPMKRAK